MASTSNMVNINDNTANLFKSMTTLVRTDTGTARKSKKQSDINNFNELE